MDIKDKMFDGHLEKELKDMTPKKKLLYLSMQIDLKYFIKNKVKKVKKKQNCKLNKVSKVKNYKNIIN